MDKKIYKQKKRVKRLVQYPFKFFTPIHFAYPVILFEDIQELQIERYIGAALYKDPDTGEFVLFLIEDNENFNVLVLPKAVANLIASKVKNAIVLINSRLENIRNAEGRIIPFVKEISEEEGL